MAVRGAGGRRHDLVVRYSSFATGCSLFWEAVSSLVFSRGLSFLANYLLWKWNCRSCMNNWCLSHASAYSSSFGWVARFVASFSPAAISAGDTGPFTAGERSSAVFFQRNWLLNAHHRHDKSVPCILNGLFFWRSFAAWRATVVTSSSRATTAEDLSVLQTLWSVIRHFVDLFAPRSVSLPSGEDGNTFLSKWAYSTGTS